MADFCEIPCKIPCLQGSSLETGAIITASPACESRSNRDIPSFGHLDGDQAERCNGNLAFASLLMAVLSMAAH
jgi:hypothetical protein